MAFSKIKYTEIKKMNEFSSSLSTTNLYTALTENATSSGIYGGYFDMVERDDKYLFVIKNGGTASAKVTIKAGNSIQATSDLVSGDISASQYMVLMIDSGHFKWVTPNKKGNDGYIDKAQSIKHGVSDITEKGKVFITADKASVNVCVFQMPV